jgi:hypothetical protein
MASKGPHQPFGQLLQRRSDSLNDLGLMPTKSRKMVDISQRVPSPLGKVPDRADEVSLAAICDRPAHKVEVEDRRFH